MNTPKETISLKYEIAVTNEDIDDIMCIALEGGITPMWCTAVKPVGGYLGQFASEQISRGGKLEFIENDGSSSFLTKSSLLNAILICTPIPRFSNGLCIAIRMAYTASIVRISTQRTPMQSCNGGCSGR